MGLAWWANPRASYDPQDKGKNEAEQRMQEQEAAYVGSAVGGNGSAALACDLRLRLRPSLGIAAHIMGWQAPKTENNRISCIS